MPDHLRGQPFALNPDWGQLTHQATAPVIPDTESAATYWYYAIALFGAAMTPYEVFFFSSGAVEEKWTVKDLGTSRLNVLVGFPLGGVLSIAIAACAAVVLLPGQIEVTSLSQTTMPVLGRRRPACLGVRHHRDRRRDVRRGAGDHPVLRVHAGPVLRLGMGQIPPARRGGPLPRSIMLTVVVGVRGGAVHRCRPDPGDRILGGVLGDRAAVDVPADPDRGQRPRIHGQVRQRRAVNIAASVYLVIILARSLAAIPLMIVTGAGQ